MSAREDVFVHPTSSVSDEATIGAGTKIWQHCTVLAGAIIGEQCMLGQNVFVEGRTRIGNRVKIKNNVTIWDCVELADDVFVGPSAVFTNVLNPRSHWPRKGCFVPTLVDRGASIGANATVVCGHRLGEMCMVGAGGVVTRDVPPFALVLGVPATQRAWVCQCGEVLRGLPVQAAEACEARCALCGSRYRLTGEGLVELERAGRSDALEGRSGDVAEGEG
jgi:UDP-2-acetamido-3-amino-2,3-dideoxy-glucuronate N-acetyltransferase